MIRYDRFCFSLFALLSTSPLIAQATPSVQTLDQHFAGTWVGVNEDYTVTPERTLDLTVTVVEDPRKHRLSMEYVYSGPRKSVPEHYKRFVVFEPATSTVLIDRKGSGGKQRQRADGLDALLKNGYGDLTLHATVRYKGDEHAVERAEYHLTPDTWDYELYVSAFGGPFVETLACSLKRVR